MYKSFLTSDLAEQLQEDPNSTWGQVLHMMVKHYGVQQRTYDGTEFDVMIAPNPEKIRMWYETHVGTKPKKQNNATKIVYHGVKITAKKIAECSGYSINTVYTYWQKSDKDGEVFSKMIDKKMTQQAKIALLDSVSKEERQIISDDDEVNIIL